MKFSILPIGEKDNEITAIPKLLDLLDIAGAIVTIDAIGCQRKIMERILAKKGHFMIPVKENQRSLLEACRAERNRLTAGGKWDSLPSCTLMKSDHGRIENYSLTVMEDTSFLLEEFPRDDVFLNIGRIGRIHKTVTEKKIGETCESETYVVTDLCTLAPETFLGVKLSHWNIEAQHWKLDVQLDEDHQRQRLGNSRTNATAFRRLVVALAKTPDHLGMTVSRFETYCQVNFDGMVREILKYVAAQK